MSLEAAPSLLLARAEIDMGHTPPALPTRAMEAATPVTALTTLDCCIVPAVEPQSGQMGETIGAGIARIAAATGAATTYPHGSHLACLDPGAVRPAARAELTTQCP